MELRATAPPDTVFSSAHALSLRAYLLELQASSVVVAAGPSVAGMWLSPNTLFFASIAAPLTGSFARHMSVACPQCRLLLRQPEDFGPACAADGLACTLALLRWSLSHTVSTVPTAALSPVSSNPSVGSTGAMLLPSASDARSTPNSNTAVPVELCLLSATAQQGQAYPLATRFSNIDAWAQRQKELITGGFGWFDGYAAIFLSGRFSTSPAVEGLVDCFATRWHINMALCMPADNAARPSRMTCHGSEGTGSVFCEAHRLALRTERVNVSRVSLCLETAF